MTKTVTVHYYYNKALLRAHVRLCPVDDELPSFCNMHTHIARNHAYRCMDDAFFLTLARMQEYGLVAKKKNSPTRSDRSTDCRIPSTPLESQVEPEGRARFNVLEIVSN